MKPKIFALGLMTLVLSACNIPVSATPAQFETPVIIATNTISTGGTVTLNNVGFTIPLGVAKDALSEMVSATTDPNNAPSWGLAPEHLEFILTGYQVPSKNLKPQIFVYPAAELAQVNTTGAGQIQKVKAVITGSPLTKETMPVVPSFNAAQQIASHMQVIDFKSGRGVRFLTQYAQYPAPINNQELFYHFQGLTTDGKYYIVAVLPVSSSILAEDDNPNAAIPQGGVPLPAGGAGDQAYYEAITKALDAMYEDSFNPSLFQLDALIQSITVAP